MDAVHRRLISMTEDQLEQESLGWFVQRIVKMNAVFRPVIQGLS